jgi:hypothetical protein
MTMEREYEMQTKLCAALVARIQKLHCDESGDTIQAIAVGAVGVLLAAVIFSTMSGVVTNNMSGLFSSVLDGLKNKATSMLGI